MNTHFDQSPSNKAATTNIKAADDGHRCRYHDEDDNDQHKNNDDNDQDESSTSMMENESITSSSSMLWCWNDDDDNDDDQKEHKDVSAPATSTVSFTTTLPTKVTHLCSRTVSSSSTEREDSIHNHTTKRQRRQTNNETVLGKRDENKEVFIVAIGTAQRNKEFELIERIKERQRKALLQEECRYCDILTSSLVSDKSNNNPANVTTNHIASSDDSKNDNAISFKNNNADNNNNADSNNADTSSADVADTTENEMQVVTVSYWNDVNAFRRYLVLQSQPQKEFQTCCYEKQLAHASKFSIEQYQPLLNPFLNYAMSSAATEARNQCWPPLHHPLDRGSSEDEATFAILIELSSSVCATTKSGEDESTKFLRQYIYTSQTCSRFEPGCLRYEVFEPWQEDNEQDNKNDNDQDEGVENNKRQQYYLVYALFSSKKHYMDHKHNQGYSLVNRYTIHTFKSMNIPMPVITTFYKSAM